MSRRTQAVWTKRLGILALGFLIFKFVRDVCRGPKILGRQKSKSHRDHPKPSPYPLCQRNLAPFQGCPSLCNETARRFQVLCPYVPSSHDGMRMRPLPDSAAPSTMSTTSAKPAAAVEPQEEED